MTNTFKTFLQENRLDDRPDSRLKNLVFKPQGELKKPKYNKLEIFIDGWQRIILPPPPREDREIDAVIQAVESATEQQVKDYNNHDKDASFAVKEYLRRNSLQYDEDSIEYLEHQVANVVRHFKNIFNRPRPYQVADLYNKTLNRFKTGTAGTPSYPSGHTVQPLVVALHYAKKYPEHKQQLEQAANICGYGRVLAGLHYPTDYEAGVELAIKLMEYIRYDKF